MMGISMSGWQYAGYTYGLQTAQKAAGTGPVEPVERAVTTPVQPVDPVGAVQPKQPQLTAGTELPPIREGADPVEMAVRGRIKPYSPAEAPLSLADMEKAKNADETGEAVEKAPSAQEVMEEAECQTCKERKYQDGSDDPGVSFKTATHIAPENVASAVRGHEQEHVVREQAKAAREGRKVVDQSVTLHTAICPECGKVYVSGGTTRTTTKAEPQEELAQQDDSKDRSGFEAVA